MPSILHGAPVITLVSQSSRLLANATARAFLITGSVAGIIGGRTTATVWPRTASRSGPDPAFGDQWPRLFNTGKWNRTPGGRGEFPVHWWGREPIDKPGTLYLAFSGDDR